MKVRVWIKGPDGPSFDFELLTAPRMGDRISVSLGSSIEEGIVEDITWQLRAAETQAGELSIEGEPVGAVSLVHVICRAAGEVLKADFAREEVDRDAEVTQINPAARRRQRQSVS